MEYRDFMTESVRIFNDRNPSYGDMRVGMGNVATLATIMTGIHLTPHDIALILHAVKLSRLAGDRANPDHYVDGINYLAFAGELVQPDTIPQSPAETETYAYMDKDISEIAAMFAPKPRQD